MTDRLSYDAQVLDRWLSDFRRIEDGHPITTTHAARVMSAKAHLPYRMMVAATTQRLRQELGR